MALLVPSPTLWRLFLAAYFRLARSAYRLRTLASKPAHTIEPGSSQSAVTTAHFMFPIFLESSSAATLGCAGKGIQPPKHAVFVFGWHHEDDSRYAGVAVGRQIFGLRAAVVDRQLEVVGVTSGVLR